MTQHQHRPIGITIIAILMIIGGIILLFTGITPLIIGPLISINISDYEIFPHCSVFNDNYTNNIIFLYDNLKII